MKLSFPKFRIKFALFTLLGVLSLNASAQKPNYGLFAGGMFAKWSGDADVLAQQVSNGMNYQSGFSGFNFTNEIRVGFTAGVFLDYPINSTFSVRPELSYAQKGTLLRSNSGTVSGNNMAMSIAIQNDYIQLPILFKTNLINHEKILVPYLLAGPNIGYLITSKMKGKAKLAGESSSETEDYEGNKDWDIGLQVGGGMKYREISFELRYQKGIQSILTEKSSDGLDIKANFLSINLLVHNF